MNVNVDVCAPDDVQLQWGVKIPLRDGVRLNATLYLPPNHPQPTPAIFTLTPYISQTSHASALSYAQHGFPFLVVDVRGRGNSEGHFRPFLQEARDGHDIVEWLAQQPYCNGKVAMSGGSYAGYNQWATATEFPPHLATIVPRASPYIGLDLPLIRSIPAPYLLQWLTLVWGRASQDKLFWNNPLYWNGKFRRWYESGAPFKSLDQQLGMPSASFQEWLDHLQLDEYWVQYNPTSEQYASISMPVLTITGAYDANQPGALEHYGLHLQHNPKAQHYLIIGPWDHAGVGAPVRSFAGIEVGSQSLVDLPQLHRQWYAWTMQEGAKPEFLQKKVAYYVMGADRWRYADTLEAITARRDTYYLGAERNPDDIFCSGTLSTEAPAQAKVPSHYLYDPRDLSVAELESTLDPWDLTHQRLIHGRVGKLLIFHSAPLPEDTEITGFFKLSAWLAIDQPDTDFRVAIYEIDLDGQSVRLSEDCQRARYRESLSEQKLIRTTAPLRYDFERFMFVSRRVKQGHRLRLTIGPVDSIHRERNYNAGGVVAEESIEDARAVTVKLFHDLEHPSALYVPLGRPCSPDEPTAPLSSLLPDAQCSPIPRS